MTRTPGLRRPRFKVVHHLRGRMRLKSNSLRDPALDASYVSALVAAQPGVLGVRINNAAASMVVEYSPDYRDMRQRVLKVLDALPAEAWAVDPMDMTAPDKSGIAVRILAAAATPFLPFKLKAVLSWMLALPTLVKAGDTLINDGLKVEVLDGSVKLFALLRRDYFTSNTVGAMLALAEYVEHATQQKSNDLLAGLLRPQVETVRVRRNQKDGQAVDLQIPFQEVGVGDLVLCGPGEMVAVDGIVVQGEASVNTASITGESLPVHTSPGKDILAGGIVEDGQLVIEASRVGSDTSTARIAGYIERSLRQTSQKQERTEKLADRLTPITLGLGLAVFAATGDLAKAASVLTVDYSCAVKLSTPVAVRATMYASGSQGVLVKGAQALESLARVDTVIFDKTGTLTQGSLQVTDALPLGHPSCSEDELLSLAAGAEQHYAHPIASAVVAEARARGLSFPDMSQVDFVVAHGVSAYVNDQRVLVGSRHFIHEDEKIDCSLADARAAEYHAQGKSLLFVARQNRLVGIIAMQDRLRPETRATLRGLKQAGVSRIVMLTGDQEAAAQALHEKLPEIDRVHAQCRPEQKAEILEQLRNEGGCPAFVGDGVNDAPALVAADVGVSMPSGAELARDTAQVLLLRDDLSGLLLARQLAVRAESILEQCLWSSVTINTGLLALAGAGFIPAVVSAAVHNSSTIGILGYAAIRGGSRVQSTIAGQDNDHDSAHF